MIFPDNENFEFFFSTFTNKINVDEISYIKHQIVEENLAVVHDGTRKIIPAKCIYVKENSVIKLKAIQNKISKYLLSIEHKSNESIVNSILYILTFLDLKSNAVQTVNEALENVTTTDLNQFLIYPIINNGYCVELDDFKIGTIDNVKIQKYCSKIGSDYYDLFGKALQDKFGVSRKYFTIKILNTIWLAKSVINYNEIAMEALTFYFDELSKVYMEDFYLKFDESQELVTFLSSSYIDLRKFNLLLYPSSYISIYLNIDKKSNFGLIIPTQRVTSMNLGSGPTLKEINNLKTKYGFEKFGKSDLDVAFKKLISFCSKGERYLIENRISESYLHYVIALDLLFGDKDSSTQSIAKRTAFIIAFSNSKKYEDTVKNIKEIYNKRSKYVHEGIEIHISKIEEVRSVCLTVFTTYLNLFKQNKLQDVKFINWLKKLDLGIAMVEATESPNSEFLINCGIESKS